MIKILKYGFFFQPLSLTASTETLKIVDSPSKTPNNKHIIPADSICVNKQLGIGEFGIVQQGVWTNGTERVSTFDSSVNENFCTQIFPIYKLCSTDSSSNKMPLSRTYANKSNGISKRGSHNAFD